MTDTYCPIVLRTSWADFDSCTKASRAAIFQVADSVAREFEHSAGLPDSRDPDLVIRRARSRRR